MREMLGFETTMKGRLRSARTRCAKRIGISREVKLAEASRAVVESGGRPCLSTLSVHGR